jgi:hypothetical protein
VREVAERLTVSRATVYALCEGGKPVFTGVSAHSMRILEGEMAAYVPEQTRADRASATVRGWARRVARGALYIV